MLGVEKEKWERNNPSSIMAQMVPVLLCHIIPSYICFFIFNNSNQTNDCTRITIKTRTNTSQPGREREGRRNYFHVDSILKPESKWIMMLL